MITDKDREDKNDSYDVALKILSLCNTESTPGNIADIINKHATESANQARQQARKYYQDVIDDYRRLTKDLDIALNGDCAAKQASLCDIVAQVRSLGTITEIILRSAEQARKEAEEKLAIAVKALEEIKTLGTHSTLSGRTTTGERIDSTTIINTYGIKARDALKEIQG